MNRLTKTTVRKPTQRAAADWRTIPAERAGVSPAVARTGGGAVKRSAVSCDGGTVAGSRSSGVVPSSKPFAVSSGTGAGVFGVSSVIEPSSDAAGGGPRRDDAGLADRNRQRAERDLPRVEREHAAAVHAGREAIHAPRCGT